MAGSRKEPIEERGRRGGRRRAYGLGLSACAVAAGYVAWWVSQLRLGCSLWAGGVLATAAGLLLALEESAR